MPLDVYIGPENLKPALLAAILSVSLLIGLFAYLNVYTRRRYFSIWMVAWLFYALWLTLTYRLESKPSLFLAMAKTWSVGISAVFLFWGSLIFMGRRIHQRMFALLVVFLLVWSYVGTYHLDEPLQAKVPIFSIMAIASVLAGRCFFVYRLRRTFAGATLLCTGFMLWGLFLGAYPFLERLSELGPTIFAIAAMLQLFIAVSMIILVLEEARLGRSAAIGRIASERAVRKNLETRVRVTEERFRNLFDQASDAILITTQNDFIVIEMNRRARTLLAVKGELSADMSLTSFLDGSPATRIHDTQRLDKVLPGAPMDLVGRDGKRNSVTVERTAIEMDGHPAYQFVFKELTERSQLEQQVRQAEKLSALGQMISGIAHELNNPLAIIKGYLDLMQNRTDLPECVRGDLRKVAHESNRAAKLVRCFLSFAREQPPQRTQFNLNQVVEAVVELLRFDSMVAQTDLSLDLDPALPLVTADQDQVQQVVINLINNALHAIVGAGVGGRIVIHTEKKDGLVQLRVEDNGPGVPTELRTKIFEPFFTTKETGAGTGLGLSIAHSIMTEHGGRIFCGTGEALGGAAFTMEFPAMSAAPELPVAAIEMPFTAERTGRVLVLDDEAALAEMVGQMLGYYGHEVEVCSTPLRALELLKERPFDAIVSDYRMPMLDGREFHARVRAVRPELAGRIIFLTGDVVSEETRVFFESIGNLRLTKPFQLETVARAVNEVLVGKPPEPAVAA